MFKKYLFLVLLFPSVFFSQEERYPIFDVCKGEQIESVKKCFFATTKKHFFSEFKTPPIVENEKFTGTANSIFVVTAQGDFKLIYVNTPYEAIKKEVKRVFDGFPKITPGWYNNHAIEMQFELPIQFPINKTKSDFIINTTNEFYFFYFNILKAVYTHTGIHMSNLIIK